MIKEFQLYLQTVRELGLPYVEYKGLFTFSFKVGAKKYLLRGSDTPFNNAASVSLARNRYCVNQMLGRAKFPVPKATAITYQQYQQVDGLKLGRLNFPVVLKPTVEVTHSDAVVCNIRDEAELREFLGKFYKSYPCASIEEYHGGLINYRVLVYQGEVVGVVERRPLQVEGDGAKTITELIQARNQQYSAEIAAGTMATVDPQAPGILQKLSHQAVTPDTVLDRGKQVRVSYSCHVMQGASSVAKGIDICMETSGMLARAAERLGLNFAEFELLCENIEKPFKKGRDVILEVNHAPDVSLYERPMSGEPIRVTKSVLSRFVDKHSAEKFKSWFARSKLFKSFYFRAGLVVGILLIVFKLIL